jgi:glyoxylase-like metal-dependent hydrolase (beta-lactamase superfamily II)
MTMKLIIFDVNNAACSLAVCPNGYSLMVDCGSHSEKEKCPVDLINSWKDNYLKLTQFNGYYLTLLHITHPDDDHVKDAKQIKEKLPPYLLHRRRFEEFPREENIHDDYKKHLDLEYRGDPIEFKFGFNQNKIFQIPMNIILKIRNCS